MRKLPVYIVVDVSESMFGEAIDQINAALDKMIAALRRNPYALETVWLSVITFDSMARVVSPLTELADFKFPELRARPGTALGTALDLLRSQIAKEVVLQTEETKGDWRPLVFLLTDGQPTDDWRPALARLRSQRPKPANIYAIGCGDEIDFEALTEIADATFYAKEASPELLAKLFIWMSSAIQSASKNASNLGLVKDDLTPPDGIQEIGDDYPPAPDFPRQLFFHATCSTTRKKYLMRLRYFDPLGMYVPAASYKVPDDFLDDGGYVPPTVSSDKIAGMPTCPHGENQDWACCGRCGAGFCFDAASSLRRGWSECPVCGARMGFADGRDSFDMTPSAG